MLFKNILTLSICVNYSSVSGGVSPSAKSQRRRAARDGEVEDAATRAARRAAWRAARLRSLEQVRDHDYIQL